MRTSTMICASFAAVVSLSASSVAGTITGDAAHRSTGARAIEICWKNPRKCVQFVPPSEYPERAKLCPAADKATKKKNFVSFSQLRAELAKDETNVVRADFATCVDRPFLHGALCINFLEKGKRGRCAYVTQAK